VPMFRYRGFILWQIHALASLITLRDHSHADSSLVYLWYELRLWKELRSRPRKEIYTFPAPHDRVGNSGHRAVLPPGRGYSIRQ